MKCKIFWGCAKEAIDAFNKWAKGKSLTREVIIHEHCYSCEGLEPNIKMVIFVYHPEGKEWDATSEIIYSEAMVEQHIEGHQSAQEIPA